MTNRQTPRAHILLGSGTNAMLEPLRLHGHDVIVVDLSRRSPASIRTVLQSVELVLMDITLASRDVLAVLHDLHASISLCDVAPRLLCFSGARRNMQFVLDIEKRGARYARVYGAPMLLEAIDLTLADMEELRKNRPHFQILHRFGRGGCASGEEVGAVLLPIARRPQLQFALSERGVFDVLASHRRIALDARQIVATLTGEWFYRNHALNSGIMQRIQVRLPAVKVVIQRIRMAMGLKFEEARQRIDPRDVLQSFPAAGTNRVLYKLNAEVQIIHSRE